MSKRSKRSTPLMLFWSKVEQRRFIDAVERLVSTVNDLQTFLAEQRRRRRPRPPASLPWDMLLSAIQALPEFAEDGRDMHTLMGAVQTFLDRAQANSDAQGSA